MPNYCDPSDVPRFGINAEAIADLSNAEIVAPTIQARSSWIDSFLNRRFTLPLLVWGFDLRQCCAVLVAWDVMSDRGFKPEEAPEDSILRVRYNDALEWLKMIGDGQVVPVVTDSTPGSSGGSGSPRAPRVGSNESRGYQGGREAFSGRRSR